MTFTRQPWKSVLGICQGHSLLFASHSGSLQGMEGFHGSLGPHSQVDLINHQQGSMWSRKENKCHCHHYASSLGSYQCPYHCPIGGNVNHEQILKLEGLITDIVLAHHWLPVTCQPLPRQKNKANQPNLMGGHPPTKVRNARTFVTRNFRPEPEARGAVTC